jgi:hypothetical protein
MTFWSIAVFGGVRLDEIRRRYEGIFERQLSDRCLDGRVSKGSQWMWECGFRLSEQR